ncbi:MAG: DUF3306 domain-containing protein [Granulosicoccus sp.]
MSKANPDNQDEETPMDAPKGLEMSDKPAANSFLDRWSSRKRQNNRQTSAASSPVNEQDDNEQDDRESGALVEHAVIEQVPVSDSDTGNQSLAGLAADVESEEQVDSLVLTDDDMPPIASLSSDSDLSGFFNKGVSAALRKAALRHVFQQPKYNLRDGLNDYDGDYTVFEPLGDTVTSDMKWHIARKERERLEALELEEQERKALEDKQIEDKQIEDDEAEVDAEEQLENVEQEYLEEELPALPNETDSADGDDLSSSERGAASDQDNSLLASTESMVGLVVERESPSERVAGKLARKEHHNLHTEDKKPQLADASRGHIDNAQDHEE